MRLAQGEDNMKAGDLVRIKEVHLKSLPGRLGLGLITSIELGGYAWVFFEGWTENCKWVETRDLEVVSEIRETRSSAE